MKLLLINLLFLSTLFSSEISVAKSKYSSQIIPKNMTSKVKKERFFYLLAPAVKKVYSELFSQYSMIKTDIDSKKNNPKIAFLKEKFKVESDEALLLALKPHPASIALAQAAMESAWATSRFFTQANNVFGMWSYNKNEPRIAAGEQREGKKTIWLKKFNTIEDSIRAYYTMMGRGYAYKEFRTFRYESNDVFKIITGLNKYSEIREKYVKQLASLIRYNKLTKYD